MFTGLIEHVGEIKGVDPQGDGSARLRVDIGPLSGDCSLGDSIAIDGCCLTVVTLNGSDVEFEAVPETLRRTTLGQLKPGSKVNLERALLSEKRLGGHFVQGHVDGTATVKKTVTGGRWAEWHLELDQSDLGLQVVEKGSIAVDGISLTVAGGGGDPTFWVALIPETLERTTIGTKIEGQQVNIETDILGKYVQAMLERKGASPDSPGEAPTKLTLAWLKERGY